MRARSSTGTAFRGSTSRARSCSSATPTGRVTSAFTPDFYLPDQDLYVEVTVMRQPLVTRKNRKLRAAPATLPRRTCQALLPARHRAPRPAIPAQARVSDALRPPGTRSATCTSPGPRSRHASASSERQLARDYDGLEPRAGGAAQVEHRVPRRPLARAPHPPRARLRRARRLRGRPRRRRPPAQGSRHGRSSAARPARRGRRRHRPDPALPGAHARAARRRRASRR